MADCIECGKKIGLFIKGEYGRCADCSILYRLEHRESVVPEESESGKAIKKQHDEVIESVILTTDYGHDLKILKRVEIVTAECAFGMNIFKDLFAGVRDIVGGRSEAVQKTMRDARKTALFELKREAHLVGANAVIGVDLDYVELSNVGSMIMLVASGTAVIIEE